LGRIGIRKARAAPNSKDSLEPGETTPVDDVGDGSVSEFRNEDPLSRFGLMFKLRFGRSRSGSIMVGEGWFRWSCSTAVV
jgi:hypothetical protein